ncbi:hypothetical protein EDB81DRAFT_885750 [Dactylonectria macrodidyma]|uniref:Major facilitator superfamily (MFS) profile domain-containing protein n=1 Tax=Dactylonectria macrodidyma TaxID=307937 RepID=A0A9P9EPP8_9HYPO|nr:hypothetical protein EDB81DRAFT_885750 [Dactylonectria macrodidyma]
MAGRTQASVEKATSPIESQKDGLKLDDAALNAAARGQATTGYETLSIWETTKAFKVATLICFAAAFSAATDGYHIGMNGSIIANLGFVKQFATEENTSGELYLASPVLAGWSSIMSLYVPMPQG